MSFAAINGAVLAIADGEASVTTEAIEKPATLDGWRDVLAQIGLVMTIATWGNVVPIMFGGGLAALIGTLDDVLDLRARWQFLGQFGVATDGVAWEAHVVGFTIGAVTALLLRYTLGKSRRDR